MALPDPKDVMTAEKLKEFEELMRLRPPPMQKIDSMWGSEVSRRFSDHMSDAMLYGVSTQKVSPVRTQVPPQADKFTETNMNALINMRMGWNLAGAKCPLTKIAAHRLNDEQAIVFIIVSGRALIIHDDLNLFPSDALVTQLRLLAD